MREAVVDELLKMNLDDLDGEIRVDVLRRLAEQAMTDLEFRAVAREDLLAALDQFGYELNEPEMALVLRFRSALAEAGIDLFLEEPLSDDYMQLLQQVLP